MLHNVCSLEILDLNSAVEELKVYRRNNENIQKQLTAIRISMSSLADRITFIENRADQDLTIGHAVTRRLVSLEEPARLIRSDSPEESAGSVKNTSKQRYNKQQKNDEGNENADNFEYKMYVNFIKLYENVYHQIIPVFHN